MGKREELVAKLEEARAALRRQSDRVDNYSGNNPNFGQSDLRSAMSTVRSAAYELEIFDRAEAAKKAANPPPAGG